MATAQTKHDQQTNAHYEVELEQELEDEVELEQELEEEVELDVGASGGSVMCHWLHISVCYSKLSYTTNSHSVFQIFHAGRHIDTIPTECFRITRMEQKVVQYSSIGYPCKALADWL